MRWLGLSYDQVLGIRLAANAFMAKASSIVWFTLRVLADTNRIWAIASLVTAAELEPNQGAGLGSLFRTPLAKFSISQVSF
jgi:hypothetical protein